MKKSILALFAVAVVLVSCKQKNKENEALNNTMMGHDSSMVMTDAAMKDMGVEKVATVTSKEASPYVSEIIIGYIDLKNELVKDNSNGASDKAKILLASFKKFDTTVLNAEQKKVYLDIADDAIENVEHIGDNAGKLEHQREHFVFLSKDINDLITTFGTKQKLYQDFCPMADNNKGAIWISETKEIKNPYLGEKMPTCGTVKQEF